METTYEPTMSMREARVRYFAANQFGEKGGYDDAWVHASIGPVPFPFPNTAGRVRAVRYHDLHHIVTGYPTTTVGEFEIAAWELGAGCRDFHAAWVLNLGGTGAGAVVAPGRVFRAFVRGLHSESLYGRDLDALLDGTVAEARRLSGADTAASIPATAADRARFALVALAGMAVGSLSFAVALPLLPFGLAAGAWQRLTGTPAAEKPAAG
jgi:hypothetical protein